MGRRGGTSERAGGSHIERSPDGDDDDALPLFVSLIESHVLTAKSGAMEASSPRPWMVGRRRVNKWMVHKEMEGAERSRTQLLFPPSILPAYAHRGNSWMGEGDGESGSIGGG